MPIIEMPMPEDVVLVDGFSDEPIKQRTPTKGPDGKVLVKDGVIQFTEKDATVSLKDILVNIMANPKWASTPKWMWAQREIQMAYREAVKTKAKVWRLAEEEHSMLIECRDNPEMQTIDNKGQAGITPGLGFNPSIMWQLVPLLTSMDKPVKKIGKLAEPEVSTPEALPEPHQPSMVS